MATEQQTFDVPEKDPWRNRSTLEGLYHGDDLNQSEIAEYFTENGHEVTAPTISYWMGKLEIDTTHTDHSKRETEDGECVTCGENTPGPENYLCDDCIDEARNGDRNE